MHSARSALQTLRLVKPSGRREWGARQPGYRLGVLGLRPARGTCKRAEVDLWSARFAARPPRGAPPCRLSSVG